MKKKSPKSKLKPIKRLHSKKDVNYLERIAKALESIDLTLKSKKDMDTLVGLQDGLSEINTYVDSNGNMVSGTGFTQSSNTITITDDGKLKTSEIIAKMREKFPVWCYYKDTIDEEFPAPSKPTTRKFLANPEPDPETLGLSVRQAEEKGYKNGITLRERLLLELAYFEKTGEHLDEKGVTFCAGSRGSDGYVPRVDWRGSKVRVDWYSLDYSGSKFGIRSAVSL